MVSPSVLNGRIYRAAFLPLLLTLAIAGFSLSDRPAPLSSNLAPDAFQGASAGLQSLAARFPDRRPGSPGDRKLANYVAAVLRELGGTARGGFAVATHSVRAQTIEGPRTLTTIVAQRPGTSGEPPIAILAHRDAATAPDRPELSATAVLLELAHVFAASEARRGIVLVSTSGGSGGNAGARDFAAHAASWTGGPLDAALVLGDLGSLVGKPFVEPFSAAPGAAPQLLARTVSQAVSQQVGIAPGAPTLLDRLAQLSFPLTAGEQGPLGAHDLPAVLLQVGGELPPPADASLSPARLEGLGRAALAAVYALDAGPDVANGAGGGGGLETSLAIQRKLLPEWAVRLVVAALLLPPLLTAGDGLARLRRRRRASAEGSSLVRWTLWVAACGLPFFLCALFALALGWLGVFAAPRPPVASSALPFEGSALQAVLAVALVLALAWLAWPVLMRRMELPARPGADVAGLALVLVLGALAIVVWTLDPYTALLLVPALHLWLVLAAPERPAGPRALGSLALVALGAAPPALLVAFYAQRLGLGLGGVAHTAVLLLAGGRVGLAGAVLWSLALGCLAAALLIALAPRRERIGEPGGPGDGIADEPLTIRGGWVGSKSSYAGPGSLGGTESALRR
jgi:hypothetical protein